MELDVKAERARVEAELEKLNAELQALDGRRQEVVNEMVQRQGVLAFLERLDGASPAKGRR